MREIILIKNGELTLKGLNRQIFEEKMITNLRRKLKKFGEVKIRKAQSAVYVEPEGEDFDFEGALKETETVFGVAAFSRALVCEKSFEDIAAKAPVYLKNVLKNVKTFKVEAKRADKTFPLTSPEICAEIGGILLENFPNLSVDVHNPDITVVVEIRDFGAYVRAGQIKGAGGLPVGTSGRAQVLISGGIDSPVAAYMMAKRGLILNAIHFASPPYTSPRAEQKVKTLLSKVARYAGTVKLSIVPFTEIQEEIGRCCPEDYFTLIMRRMMMRISCKVARKDGCLALVTGESLGQVASQTLPSIAATECVSDIPTLRPLIGMDKEEIIEISRKIDAFETSILPYEDCCTVFTPRHPHTRPKEGQCEKAEEKLDIDVLIERAIEGIRVEYIDSE